MFVAKRALAVSTKAAFPKAISVPKVSASVIQRAGISSGKINKKPLAQTATEAATAAPQGQSISAIVEDHINLRAATQSNLSPTLNKFCLDGKVAVVTGYVCCLISTIVVSC